MLTTVVHRPWALSKGKLRQDAARAEAPPRSCTPAITSHECWEYRGRQPRVITFSHETQAAILPRVSGRSHLVERFRRSIISSLHQLGDGHHLRAQRGLQHSFILRQKYKAPPLVVLNHRIHIRDCSLLPYGLNVSVSREAKLAQQIKRVVALR